MTADFAGVVLKLVDVISKSAASVRMRFVQVQYLIDTLLSQLSIDILPFSLPLYLRETPPSASFHIPLNRQEELSLLYNSLARTPLDSHQKYRNHHIKRFPIPN